jgi:hypothetical protein
MQRSLYILPFAIAGNLLSEPVTNPPGFLNSRAVMLTCQSSNEAEIQQIHVWFSTDRAQSWQKATVTRTGPLQVRFDAEDDGNYLFYIVLENESGNSGPPPAADSKPHLAVIIDTAPPTLQIHDAAQTVAPDGNAQLAVKLSLVDEHLGVSGTRLFYRSHPEADWTDVGPVAPAGGMVTWSPPADIPNEIDIRVVATDLAGNQTFDELCGLAIDRTEPSAPAGSAAAPGLEVEPLAPVRVEPVTLVPVPAVTLTDEPPAATPPPPTQQVGQLELLRTQAADFLAQGQLALASARLHQALELAPDDANLLVELGSILFRTRQYDRAASRFARALDAAPDHVGAIEGLALVAVNQRRYSEARSHLEHLLRLCPEAADHWMHFGDVEHMLGNVANARTAWKKALQLEPADQTIREETEKRLRLFGQGPGIAK